MTISSKFIVMELMSLLDQAYDGYQIGQKLHNITKRLSQILDPQTQYTQPLAQ